MNPDLENLRITGQELEELSGFDVSAVFVGSVLGGTVRPSIFRDPKRWLWFGLTEVIVSVLAFVFTLPLGLLAIRDSMNAINSFSVAFRFLTVTLSLTFALIVGWNLYLWTKTNRLKMLMHLLDEVDKYNEVLDAIEVLDRLEAIGSSKISLTNRSDILSALAATRSSLVSGLMTEKILRQNRQLLARRYDLIANIENNLFALRVLEVKDQASEYGQLLNEALAIGMSVHQEVQKLSR